MIWRSGKRKNMIVYCLNLVLVRVCWKLGVVGVGLLSVLLIRVVLLWV